MAIKRYISKTGVKYTFLVKVKDSVKSISFKGNEKDCIIKDPATQKALENHEHFLHGRIGVAPGTSAGGFDEDIDGLGGNETTKDKLKVKRSDSRTQAEKDADKEKAKSGGLTVEIIVYDDVTDIQAAKDILQGEPYKVAHQSLRTPQAILVKAKELGIYFPNLNVE